MKIRSTAALAVALSLSSTAALADSESWYTYWALGVSNSKLPSGFEAVFDSYERAGGSRTGIGLDMLGFYWPMDNERTAIGFVITSSADAIEAQGNRFQLTQYTYGLSTMHFFGNEIGDGAFLRGDLGMARGVITADLGGDAASKWGYGTMVGAGYGWPISTGTRILLSLDYSVRRIESETYTSGRISVGGLW